MKEDTAILPVVKKRPGLVDVLSSVLEDVEDDRVRLFYIGRAGDLKRPAPLAEVAARVKRSLKVRAVEVVGRLPGRTRVRRMAVIGGAAGGGWPQAMAAGAQVLVTGEMKHSDRLASSEAGLVTIVAGHFATEKPAVEGLAEIVATALPQVKVTASADETNPTAWR